MNCFKEAALQMLSIFKHRDFLFFLLTFAWIIPAIVLFVAFVVLLAVGLNALVATFSGFTTFFLLILMLLLVIYLVLVTFNCSAKYVTKLREIPIANEYLKWLKSEF